jgi:hypothetical protein
LVTSVLADYVNAFGWSVAVSNGAVMLDCGRTVDVVTMPMGLGGEVNHILMTHGLTTPVFATNQEAHHWAFLTVPKPLDANDAAIRSLSLHHVKHLGSGQSVRLPADTGRRDSLPRWIVPPSRSPGLPPWNALVLCAVMAVRR